jgi:mRNA interferase YafQ
MFKINTTNRFNKSLKLCTKRNYDLTLLKVVIDLLALDGKLPQKYNAHKMKWFCYCWIREHILIYFEFL